MKISLVKTNAGLIAATDEDQAMMATLETGEVYEFQVRKFRNYKFHRKFFAMLNIVYDNQEQYHNFDHFRKVITMKAGYFDEVVTEKGVVFLPKSIAFDKMDQSDFEKLYDKVLDECIKIVPVSKEEIQKELAGFG